MKHANLQAGTLSRAAPPVAREAGAAPGVANWITTMPARQSNVTPTTAVGYSSPNISSEALPFSPVETQKNPPAPNRNAAEVPMRRARMPGLQISRLAPRVAGRPWLPA